MIDVDTSLPRLIAKIGVSFAFAVFDLSLDAVRKFRKDRRSMLFGVQPSAEGQHGVANGFYFQTFGTESPERMIVGIRLFRFWIGNLGGLAVGA